MDQTGINYENIPSRTIDFAGSREIAVKSQNNEKKRLTLFSLINAAGELFPQFAVIKGARDARIHDEVRDYDDGMTTLHTCQINAWCNHENLIEWYSRIWYHIAQMFPGPKILILDSYPLHLELQYLFARHETTVLYIPAGLTFTLQPLDMGFSNC